MACFGSIRRFVDGRDLVFVFGSNLAGRHGKGAAKFAKAHLGAVDGLGEGLSGLSYALPTKDESLSSLPIENIQAGLERLGRFAQSRPDLRFQLTRVGCGLAGYSDAEMIGAVKASNSLLLAKNVILPGIWREELDPTLAILGVVGCRHARAVEPIFSAITYVIKELQEQGKEKIILCSGGAPGVDTIAEEFARRHEAAMTVFEANWDKYRLAAGPNRNSTLAWYCSEVLAFPSQESKGTRDMIATSKREHLRVQVIEI